MPTVCRAFAATLVPAPTPADLTPAVVRGYRDALEHAGRSLATVAEHLSALRGLADALGSDPATRTVRSARVARGEPRALTRDEYARLPRIPDRGTRQGKRDLALLHLLGFAGLRRAEAASVRRRRRRAAPRGRRPAAPGIPALDGLVGDRPLRQARPRPPGRPKWNGIRR